MSCWACRHQQLDSVTLLGVCGWYALNGRAPEEIPAAIVDVGCKFKQEKPNEQSND